MDKNPLLETNDKIILYQIYNERRNNYNTLMWQVPSMCFIGLSFLIFIEIAQVSIIIHILTCVFICIFAFATFQLMKKHHYYEICYSIEIERLEDELGIEKKI